MFGSVGEFGAVANDGDVSSSEESQTREPLLKTSLLKSPKNGDCSGAADGMEEFLWRDGDDMSLLGETGADCVTSKVLGLGEKMDQGFSCITGI